jgi:hypothetical protein
MVSMSGSVAARHGHDRQADAGRQRFAIVVAVPDVDRVATGALVAAGEVTTAAAAAAVTGRSGVTAAAIAVATVAAERR